MRLSIIVNFIESCNSYRTACQRSVTGLDRRPPAAARRAACVAHSSHPLHSPNRPLSSGTMPPCAWAETATCTPTGRTSPATRRTGCRASLSSASRRRPPRSAAAPSWPPAATSWPSSAGGADAGGGGRYAGARRLPAACCRGGGVAQRGAGPRWCSIEGLRPFKRRRGCRADPAQPWAESGTAPGLLLLLRAQLPPAAAPSAAGRPL